MIPIAALVGVMFMVVIGTFAWNSIKFLMMVPRSDALVTVLVTFVTVLEDLAVAVIVGVIVSALVYAWKTASRIRAIERPSKTDKGAKVYEIEGPLFFSSANSFLELFNPDSNPDSSVEKNYKKYNSEPDGYCCYNSMDILLYLTKSGIGFLIRMILFFYFF